MKKILCFITCLTCAKAFMAQSMYSGYRAVGTYSQHFTDVFSVAVNQASLAQIKEAAAGIYSERRFMLEELTVYSAAIATPFKYGGVALIAGLTGNKDYSQSNLGLAYGRALGEKASLGIQFNYNRAHVAGYGSEGSVAVEIGSVLHVTEKLHVGCHVYKPFGGTQGNYFKDDLPPVYHFGSGYEVTEQLLMTTVIEKEEGQPVKVNVAMHYALMKQFFLRGGITSSEGLSFVGAGLTWKNFRTDVCASWHSQLGFSPAMLLVFRFKSEEQGQ